MKLIILLKFDIGIFKVQLTCFCFDMAFQNLSDRKHCELLLAVIKNLLPIPTMHIVRQPIIAVFITLIKQHGTAETRVTKHKNESVAAHSKHY